MVAVTKSQVDESELDGEADEDWDEDDCEHPVVERFTHAGMHVTIEYDQDPGSPREDDNLGTMYCWHDRHNLGDKHSIRREDYGSTQELLAAIAPKGSVVLPLYTYEHGGIAMHTSRSGQFADPWDSSAVGWIVATPEEIRDNFGCKRISAKLRARTEEILRSDVKVYDQWLQGEVYGYTVEDPAGIVDEDSCWGFYGLDDVRQEAKGIAEGMAEEKRKAQIDTYAI